MSRRILVVDDSPFTGEAVAWALRGAGFDVEVARDLWDLEREDLKTPDLVFMDVVLQEAFGDDLAMLLRGVRGFECPIVLLSSLPDHLLERRAADADLNGFISKRAGLSGIVERARTILGSSGKDADAAATTSDRFVTIARQRARRIVHVWASEKKWNATAIVGEAHALAGDADLAGAAEISEAARAVRDVAQRLGSSGATPEIAAMVEALAKSLAGTTTSNGNVLLVGATTFSQDSLLAALDDAGFVVIEAHSIVELRPKLHAADYDVVLVEQQLATAEASMLLEIRPATAAPIVIMREGPNSGGAFTEVDTTKGAHAVVDEVRRMIERA